jgi:hypothetical protein
MQSLRKCSGWSVVHLNVKTLFKVDRREERSRQKRVYNLTTHEIKLRVK